MPQEFANNATSILVAAINASQTYLEVEDGTAFPNPGASDYYLATIHTADYSEWEIVKVTSRDGNDFDVIEREHEGTAQAWIAGVFVSANLTQDTMENLRDDTATALSNAATALSTANAADSKADDALDAVAEAGISATLQVRVTGAYNSLDLEDLLRVERYSGWALLYGGSRGYPTFGFSPKDWFQVQVYRNTDIQVFFYDDEDWGSPIYGDLYRIKGHRWIEFKPDLTTDDVITIVGAYNSGRDDYSVDTVATYGYVAGGRESGNLIDDYQQLDLQTHSLSLITETMNQNSESGADAVSSVTYGWQIGGTATTNYERFDNTLHTATAYASGMSVGTTGNRAVVTDGSVEAFLIGPSTDTDSVQKLTFATPAWSTTSITCSTDQQHSGVTDNTDSYGYTLRSGSAYVEKLTFSTESLSSIDRSTTTSGGTAAAFDTNIAYFAGGNLQKFAMATETYTQTALDNGSFSPTKLGISDGTTYAVSVEETFVAATETTTFVGYIGYQADLVNNNIITPAAGEWSDDWTQS